jgi:dCMP deaminase
MKVMANCRCPDPNKKLHKSLCPTCKAIEESAKKECVTPFPLLEVKTAPSQPWVDVRPSWDQYFLEIATVVATRSTCRRKRVGAVLVRDRVIVSTGYGGSVRGQPHCLEAGCDIDPATKGCRRTVHAEMNAIAQAALNGVSTRDTTAYVTLSPCEWCFRTMANAGIVRIVYAEQYRVPPNFEFAKECGVEMLHLQD